MHIYVIVFYQVLQLSQKLGVFFVKLEYFKLNNHLFTANSVFTLKSRQAKVLMHYYVVIYHQVARMLQNWTVSCEITVNGTNVAFTSL